MNIFGHVNKKKSSLNAKYRPQFFRDIILQPGIKSFLINSIKTNQIGNAFLFYGERGVGKTTLARIFARSLNCTAKVDGFESCGSCQSCIGISLKSNSDVFEIDAASTNNVDSVRNLIEETKYLPVQSKYKIYILDEVHMFSQSAFNALLKILEEPPSYVVFLLSTTEFQKIPKTIVSRCHSLNIKLLRDFDIGERLREICNNEDIKIDDKSLSAIISCAKGSMRDGVSLLDQVSILTSKNIEFSETRKILAIDDNRFLKDFLVSILSKDSDNSLKILKEMEGDFMNPVLFIEKVLNFLLLSMIINSKENMTLNSLISYGFLEEEIRFVGENFDYMRLKFTSEILTWGHNLLKTTIYSDHYSVFHLVVLRICYFDSDEDKKNISEKERKLTVENSAKKNDFVNSNSAIVSNSIEEKIILKEKNIEEKVTESIIITHQDNHDSENNIEIKEIEIEKKEFTHQDLLLNIDENDLKIIAKENESIFDYSKYEIHDFNRVPARYLQTFLKILRNNSGKKWRIVFKDNDEKVKHEKETIENVLAKYSTFKNEKVEEINAEDDESKSLYDEIKKDFMRNSKVYSEVGKIFNITSDKIKVSR